MASTSTALQFKEEGNAFFVKKDFKNAHKKYTEAIALDGQNAILYANRSACSLGMGSFLDASRDARKATELDPGYAKGWSRRACADEALLNWKSCIESWEKALNALPETDLSPAELKQKEQYSAFLKRAQQRQLEDSSTPPWIVMSFKDKHPWQLASEMLPELKAMGTSGYTSSAWVVHGAYKEFVEGVEAMKSLKKINIQGASQRYGLFGNTFGLTCISNGVMRDIRVFHMDISDWIAKYNNQVLFEAQKHKAWVSENLEDIKKEAQERQKKGWDHVRPALSVTVRAWVMRAIFDHSLRGAPHVSVEMLKQTLDLLEWGRQIWKDASKEDRGSIFQDTFVRGVRSIYLEVLMQAYTNGPGVDKKAILDTLFKEANHVLLESHAPQQTSDEPIDPGFASSFYVYPLGKAHAMLGYYHSQMAKSSPFPELSFSMAGVEYTEAALAYPEDDEYHCFYLQCAIRCMLASQQPISVIEAAAKRLREAMPKMQKIWANSALAKQGRDGVIKQVLDAVEERLRS